MKTILHCSRNKIPKWAYLFKDTTFYTAMYSKYLGQEQDFLVFLFQQRDNRTRSLSIHIILSSQVCYLVTATGTNRPPPGLLLPDKAEVPFKLVSSQLV